MSPVSPQRPSARGDEQRASGSGAVLGIPLPLLIIALIIAGLLGMQLAGSLQLATSSSPRGGATSVDSLSGGKNSAGDAVITESTLGTEVQRRAMALATILEPLLIVVMGAVVMLIVLAVLLPIIQLNTWVK